MVNPNNTTSSGQDHVDPWNRSSSWWDRSWQSQDQWYDRSWQDNRDWDSRARSTQPTSSTETRGWNRRSRASSAATWQEEAARSNRTPRRDSRFTQDRNRRGHRSVAATQRRIDRGQERRRQAELAAQQAQAVTQTEPQQGDTAPPEPSRPPRVSTSERRARSAPPPGQAALEANEEAEVSLVPRKDRRRRDKAETKAEPQEPILEEELEEVLEEELPASSSVRVPTPPRVPDEHYISEARRILDQPQPEVPEEIAAAAADAPAEESGNETEVEWGDSLSSYSSYEVCEIPDLETARREAEAVAAQTKWLEQRRLQAPPLYATGVAGSTARSSADSKGPAVEAELSKALDLCDQIQGVLSQSSQQPKPPLTTEVVDERPEEERDDRPTTGHRRNAAEDGCSSESDASAEYRPSEPGATERPAAAGKARAGPAPDRRYGTIAAILAADRERRRRPRASSPAPERGNTRRKQ